jgi:hypothetical protein
MPLLNMDSYHRNRRDVDDSTVPNSGGGSSPIALDMSSSTARPSAIQNLQNKIMDEINACKY